KGSVAIVAHPLIEVLGPRAEVDHRASRGEQPAVRFGDHYPAAGRKHDAVERGELGHRLHFARAKARFALDLEDIPYAYAAAALDLHVGIEKTQLQGAREHAPDRGLAGAHQADEVDVARASHAVIVETKTAGGTRPSRRQCCRRQETRRFSEW